MRITRWLTAAGLVGAATAATLSLGATPASADITTVRNDHQICTQYGGTWADYGLGAYHRYSCTHQGPNSWYEYFYFASGEISTFASGTGTLLNGGSPGNYHEP